MGNNCKKSRSTSSSPSTTIYGTTESITDRVCSNEGSYLKIGRASRPTLRDIDAHVIPRICTNWFSLGLQLLDPKYKKDLIIIEADARNDAATSCRKMFSKWLNTDELCSWDKLIKALEILNLNDVANGIEQLLLQGKHVSY